MSQARLRCLKAAKGGKKGPMVPRECAGHQQQQEGKHQAELRTTQICTTDNLSHTFLLYTKATKEKGRWERLYKANLTQKISPLYTSFQKGMGCLDEEIQFYPVQVSNKKRKKKSICQETIASSTHLRKSQQTTENVRIHLLILFLISSFKINWC